MPACACSMLKMHILSVYLYILESYTARFYNSLPENLSSKRNFFLFLRTILIQWFVCRRLLVAGVKNWLILPKIHRKDLECSLTALVFSLILILKNWKYDTSYIHTSIRFRFVLSPQPTPATLFLLQRCKWAADKELEKLEHVEVCAKAMELTGAMAKRIGSDGGGALIIDYGLNGVVTDSLQVWSLNVPYFVQFFFFFWVIEMLLMP